MRNKDILDYIRSLSVQDLRVWRCWGIRTTPNPEKIGAVLSIHYSYDIPSIICLPSFEKALQKQD